MSEASEIQAAVAANDAFYQAFAAGDVDAMDGLWSGTAPVLCVHPGMPALHGRDSVVQSWREILAEPPPIKHSTTQVAVVRGVAFVTCLEHLGTDATLAATNVFVWEDKAWRLVLHQAGAVHRLDPEFEMPDGPLH
jgi:ketosteroid isomerase-like protein